MTYLVKILVEKRKSIQSPEASAIQRATNMLDYKISELKMSKYFSYLSHKNSEEEVRDEAKSLSDKLFANPTMEDYKILSIEEIVKKR